MLKLKSILLNGCWIKTQYSHFFWWYIYRRPHNCSFQLPNAHIEISHSTNNDVFIYLQQFNLLNKAPLTTTAFIYEKNGSWQQSVACSSINNSRIMISWLCTCGLFNLLHVIVRVCPHADFIPCWWIIWCALLFPLLSLVAMAMRVGAR